MKWRTLLTAASLSSLLLSACGTNNDIGDGNTALQSPDDYEQRSVRYNTNDSIGLNMNPYDTVQNDNNPKMTKNQERCNLANENMNDNARTNEGDRTNTIRNVNNKNENRIDVADRAADKIVEMREVDRANVIVTGNNAYVAAKLTDNANNKLSKDVEKKISDLVKSENRNIDDVYVSVNPDFYNRTNSYANDIRDGRPIEGFFDEFNTLVRRVFPTNR
jgi:spore cortex protein